MPTPYVYNTYTSVPGFVALAAGDSFNILPTGGLTAQGFTVTAGPGITGLSAVINGYMQVQSFALNGQDHISVGPNGVVMSFDANQPLFFLGGFGGTDFNNSGDINALGNTAIRSFGGNNTLTNSGSVRGVIGVDLGFGQSLGDTFLNSGQITGIQTGVLLSGSSTLRNMGNIAGLEQEGLRIAGDFNGENTAPIYQFVYNFGTITSSSLATSAITVNLLDADSIVNLSNDGTISGNFQAYASSGLALDNLRNSGVINGVVALGDGADYFDGRSGTLNGDLNLGTGADTADLRGSTTNGVVYGQAGDDTYYVDQASVAVVEFAAQGLDHVLAASSFRLGAEIEQLTLLDVGNFNGTGNVLANTITGNVGDNRLNGIDGADTLRGDLGDDRLNGGASADLVEGGDGDDLLQGNTGNDTMRGDLGDDQLTGGVGIDNMTGGAGADRFIFAVLGHSGTTIGSADVITDFTQGEDLINLQALDANRNNTAPNDTFTFIAGAFTNVAGQVHAVQNAGNTYVEMDVDGNSIADCMIKINGLLVLTAADFVL